MESKFGSRSKGGSSQAVLGVVLSSLLLGGLLVGYFFYWRSDDAAGPGNPQTVAAPQNGSATIASGASAGDQPATVAEVAVATQEVERVTEQQGGLDQRLAAAEQRLARLDLQAQAAAGNAARAEGLLIAFASRRAIERGVELGYLADQLRLRFGDAWPNAVRTIIAFSRQPVTLDQLLSRLEALGPQLETGDKSISWDGFKRELGQLFVIRREDTPSPQPERRLERARMFLETGRVDAAIGEVRNLPGATKAASWIADAERYRDVLEALDRVETAAVLEPRKLRDGAGNPVEQPSPVN
ncbi:MAG: hypothetical protein C0510_04545 [Erythrobacter sp.]|nr:hypothetical protein [Erythrobacter sp.]